MKYITIFSFLLIFTNCKAQENNLILDGIIGTITSLHLNALYGMDL